LFGGRVGQSSNKDTDFSLTCVGAKTFSFCLTFFSVCKIKTRPPLFGGRVGQSSNKDTVFSLTCVGAKTFSFCLLFLFSKEKVS